MAQGVVSSARVPPLNAEVIGFDGDRLILACEELVGGVSPGAFVTVVEGSNQIEVGDALLGRVLDGAGSPLMGRLFFRRRHILCAEVP